MSKPDVTKAQQHALVVWIVGQLLAQATSGPSRIVAMVCVTVLAVAWIVADVALRKARSHIEREQVRADANQ